MAKSNGKLSDTINPDTRVACGEWPDGELFIVVVSHADGELTGIAPLFFTKNREGLPALLLLGSIEISDYLDFIVRTSELPEFTGTLLDFLASSEAPRFVEVAEEMTRKILALGPNPIKTARSKMAA